MKKPAVVDPDLIWSSPDGEIRRYDSRLNIICRECRKAARKGGSEMRKFKIIIETGIAGGDFEDVFEVDDDATPEEIHDGA